MFAFLSKKISIPNDHTLRTVSWNNRDNYIVCGGDGGFLKVLLLAEQEDPNSLRLIDRGIAAPANLVTNQSLETHKGHVISAVWNEQHRKLTTADTAGTIVVWVLHNGIWYEEMVSNRNKCPVSCVSWGSDGKKICILYEDGTTIVGTVDGARLWAKDLRTKMRLCQWSPDAKTIMLATDSGEILFYDLFGNYLMKWVNDIGQRNRRVVGLEVYNGNFGYIEAHVPCLAMVFEDDQIYLLNDEKDKRPIILDPGLLGVIVRWNHNGSMFAAGGYSGTEKSLVLSFYDPYGTHLHSIRVPGKLMSSFTWENGSLRLALAIDSSIYFVTLRPNYKRAYMGIMGGNLASGSLVYGYQRFTRGEDVNGIMFWNPRSGEMNRKHIPKLMHLASYADRCLFVTAPSQAYPNQYSLFICNAIGSIIDMKLFDFCPSIVQISKYHIVWTSADSSTVFIWQYRSERDMTNDATNLTDVIGESIDARLKEIAFSIDDMLVEGAKPEFGEEALLKVRSKPVSRSPVTALAINEHALFLATRKGTIIQIGIADFTVQRILTDYERIVTKQPTASIDKIFINSDSTKLALIDRLNVLRLIPVKIRNLDNGAVSLDNAAAGILLPFERRDVWDFVWSTDNPEMFAVVEKSKLTVFRQQEPEDSIACSGYLLAFTDLRLKLAMYDEIMSLPEQPQRQQVLPAESKTLRDTRRMLTEIGFQETFQYVQQNPHPRLWRLLGEATLQSLDLESANKCFVNCSDYYSIQFIKRIQYIDDREKLRAEVAAYFGRFDESDQIYTSIDRRDLSLDLRLRLSDWLSVQQIMDQDKSLAIDDRLVERVKQSLGDLYFDRKKYAQALPHYEQGRCYDRMSDCYYQMEEFESLQRLADSLPDGHGCLPKIARQFSSVGMAAASVKTFIKVGDIKSAVEACIQLNQWDEAFKIAETYDLTDITTLLAQYAQHLLDNKKYASAIELYRKVNYCDKSAKHLFDWAEEAATQGKPLLQIKKLFVLAAMELDQYNQQRSKQATSEIEATLAAEQTALKISSKYADNPWHPAEAYHFYMLCQSQMYAGDYEAAYRTALRLIEYDDVITPKICYSLLALVSYYANHFGSCSRAFVKLETLESTAVNTVGGKPSWQLEEPDSFERLGGDIFTKNLPLDPAMLRLPCMHCQTLVDDCETACPTCLSHFSACVATGQPIINQPFHICTTCQHRALEMEIARIRCCPLCHSVI